jgi:hypothetical protein
MTPHWWLEREKVMSATVEGAPRKFLQDPFAKSEVSVEYMPRNEVCQALNQQTDSSSTKAR